MVLKWRGEEINKRRRKESTCQYQPCQLLKPWVKPWILQHQLPRSGILGHNQANMGWWKEGISLPLSTQEFLFSSFSPWQWSSRGLFSLKSCEFHWSHWFWVLGFNPSVRHQEIVMGCRSWPPAEPFSSQLSWGLDLGIHTDAFRKYFPKCRV